MPIKETMKMKRMMKMNNQLSILMKTLCELNEQRYYYYFNN